MVRIGVSPMFVLMTSQKVVALESRCEGRLVGVATSGVCTRRRTTVAAMGNKNAVQCCSRVTSVITITCHQGNLFEICISSN